MRSDLPTIFKTRELNRFPSRFTTVWTSPYGYNHQEIGRKVSQLQAVLARRCAAVGELQQHLLRAGWHRGVAQWGGTCSLTNTYNLMSGTA